MIRSVVAVVLGLCGTVILAAAWTAATAVQLTATALIIGGTGHSLGTPADDPVSFINPYMNNAVNEFINLAAARPTGTGGEPLAGVGPGDDRYAVITPEQFFPLAGSMTFDRSVAIGRANLNGCIHGTGCLYNDNDLIDPAAPDAAPMVGEKFVVFGYSQSAVIASLVKRDLIENPGQTSAGSSFFLLGNPMRPNGGILARGLRGWTIPILGVTFYGPTPTDSCETGVCMPTVDAAVQYDFRGGDAPASVTNVLAWLNALAGSIYLHGPLQKGDFGDALYQGSYGDTDYYLYTTKRLPILMPFELFVPSPILTFLDAPLRAAIEGGYARDTNPGVPTKVSWLPFLDPVQTIVNIIVAIPVGIDDALAEVAGDPTFRPLGTKPVTSPFGVGGPDLPEPPSAIDDDKTPDLPEPPSATDDDKNPAVSSTSEGDGAAPDAGSVNVGGDEGGDETPAESGADGTEDGEETGDAEDGEETEARGQKVEIEEDVVDEDAEETEEALDGETSEAPDASATQGAATTGEAEPTTESTAASDSQAAA